MKKFVVLFLFVVIAFSSGIGFAASKTSASNVESTKQEKINQESTEEGAPLNLDAEQKSSDINMFSMVSSLLTVILIMLVCAWIYKKFIGVSADKLLSGKLKEAKENSISILSTIPIAQNKYLHLVEVRGQKLLIGSTANDIVMLKDIEDKKLN